ncbi:MAG: hypothetical protein Q8R92_07885, partial [Deltaproteobacteria bacterium]|nr:hypothetical protein [Deltaproteobacteria bacterium]
MRHYSEKRDFAKPGRPRGLAEWWRRPLYIQRMTRTLVVSAVAVLVAALPESLSAQQCSPHNAGLALPPGFCAVVFAESLGPVRHMAALPNGDLAVAV